MALSEETVKSIIHYPADLCTLTSSHTDTYTHTSTVYGVLSFCCYTCVNHSLSVRKEALTTKPHLTNGVMEKLNPTADKA